MRSTKTMLAGRFRKDSASEDSFVQGKLYSIILTHEKGYLVTKIFTDDTHFRLKSYEDFEAMRREWSIEGELEI